MEEWFTAPACDGFVVAATSMPGAYDDVVRLLVPELQRRGLFHKEYAGPTLRDNLGLAYRRPSTGTPCAEHLRDEPRCGFTISHYTYPAPPIGEQPFIHYAACLRQGMPGVWPTRCHLMPTRSFCISSLAK
jgi:hypothetical protein